MVVLAIKPQVIVTEGLCILALLKKKKLILPENAFSPRNCKFCSTELLYKSQVGLWVEKSFASHSGKWVFLETRRSQLLLLKEQLIR